MAFSVPSMGANTYAPFWNVNAQSPAPYTLKYARTSHMYRAALAFGQNGFRKYRAKARALNGAAVGGSAVDSRSRIQQTLPANQQLLGGVRTVETINNGTTTVTADQTAMNTLVYDRLFTRHPTSYPVDPSGNGGGAKLTR